jgi:hypothetical protein
VIIKIPIFFSFGHFFENKPCQHLRETPNPNKNIFNQDIVSPFPQV